ncbi:MAG: translation initiation factor IF-2, partial [Clostridia bacterium]|nr:translation initiation factor IF-2 [Clostridia bacterium]
MAQGTCKISILAKDLGLKNKEIIEVLTENGITGKTHSSPLSEDEFAFVIGYFTNKTQISNINDYLNGKIKIKLPKSATEPAKETTQEAAPEKKDAPQQSSDNKPAAADTKKVPENAKVAKPKPAPEKIEKKDRFANPLNQGQNAPKNVKKDKEKDKAKNNTQVLRPQPGAAKTDKNEAVTVIRSDDFSGRRAGTKVVDTRANNVDLSKYDTRLERYENYDKSSQSSSQRQKFNKKQNNQVQNNDGRVRSVQSQKNSKKQEKLPPVKQQVSISVPDEITVGELASRLKVTAAEVIKKLFGLGIMATVNQTVDYDTAEYVGTELGAIVTKEIVVTIEEKLFDESEDTEENLVERAPVVVVMGHVDHGKTSILDRIRNAHVTAGEAGGITQHIGAYKTHINGKDITFLDTPGHEAFTSMRARGAMVTDIAILVVAADDGIMPQTIEAINHAKAAGVEIIVAINKMDKPTANPDMVKQTLTQYEIIPEEWGGDTICVPVSALTGMGIDDLLESVLLIAEMKNLRANPNRAAKGTIIEARLDKGRGPVATVLVQNGTLRLGDTVIAGTSVGRVRAMTDDRGRNVKIAGPSDSVEIIGLDEVPSSGDEFNAVKDERMARELAEQRKAKSKEEQFKAASKVSLDDLFAQISEGAKELNIVVKADVGGSAEAVKASLLKLTNEEVKVNVIHSAVGGITESDVMFAAASNAIIVGFNVRPDKGAIDSAERQKVDIRTYRIIYDCLNEIEAAMKGM